MNRVVGHRRSLKPWTWDSPWYGISAVVAGLSASGVLFGLIIWITG